MARQMKQVDSATVREWANETGWRDELNRPVADRGRMPSGLIEAYNKANKRYFKEYETIPRPVRSDYRDAAPAPKAEKASAPKASRSSQDSDDSAPAPKATAPAKASTREVGNLDNTGVQSLQDVIAMLTAAENKKGGRQAVVTIQTLVTV